jgi:Zn-finger nucleic acid-binding protein
MPKSCCGQQRSSAYCPDCGKKLFDGPLAELMQHLRYAEKQNRTRAEHARMRIKDDSGMEDRLWKRKADDLGVQADRWAAWADALADVMKRAGEGA